MSKIYLEDVFKDSGIPTYTFVEPEEYAKIVVSLRTKGRCLIVEGPSGIGKTTCVLKVLESLSIKVDEVIKLSARKNHDKEIVKSILDNNDDLNKIVIIDDFHLLPDEIKEGLANLMKVIADEEREDIKLVLIGINKAGDSLVKISPDLNNRISTVKFEANPSTKIIELITKGEKVLNIKVNYKDQIISKANGSFHVTQMICKELCLMEKILETEDTIRETNLAIPNVVNNLMKDLSRVFEDVARSFSVGSRLRSEGRAPYFHLLYWLGISRDWSIRMADVYLLYPAHKASISQVVEKGFLRKLIDSDNTIKSVIHFDDNSRILTVEDPKFIFYLQNMDWNVFARKIGFSYVEFARPYDFALSFAGEQRDLANALFNILSNDYSYSVFYDFDEQYKIIAEDVEDYLTPIYESEAEYVIALIDVNYPKKIWTKFESNKFKERFGEHAVIPIIFKGINLTQFDILSSVGHLIYDPEQDLMEQIKKIAEVLSAKIEEKRRSGSRME